MGEYSGSGATPEAPAPAERLPLYGFRRRRRIGFWYRFAVAILRPLMVTFTRRVWRGAEHLPTDGGYVAAVNHLSYVDPFTFAHFLFDNGHLPRFLAKESLFRMFFVGSVMRGAKQIPVYRDDRRRDEGAARPPSTPSRPASASRSTRRRTLTRDPDLWPMQGKTGAARVALASGRPGHPDRAVGRAGDPRRRTKRLPRLLPRHTQLRRAGPPVDLSRFQDREPTAEVLARGDRRHPRRDHRAARRHPAAAAAAHALEPDDRRRTPLRQPQAAPRRDAS